jgi:hypothetical protein
MPLGVGIGSQRLEHRRVGHDEGGQRGGGDGSGHHGGGLVDHRAQVLDCPARAALVHGKRDAEGAQFG